MQLPLETEKDIRARILREIGIWRKFVASGDIWKVLYMNYQKNRERFKK